MTKIKVVETTTPCIKCRYYSEKGAYIGSCLYAKEKYSAVLGSDVRIPSRTPVLLARKIYRKGNECTKWEKRTKMDFFVQDPVLGLYIVVVISVVVLFLGSGIVRLNFGG